MRSDPPPRRPSRPPILPRDALEAAPREIAEPHQRAIFPAEGLRSRSRHARSHDDRSVGRDVESVAGERAPRKIADSGHAAAVQRKPSFPRRNFRYRRRHFRCSMLRSHGCRACRRRDRRAPSWRWLASGMLRPTVGGEKLKPTATEPSPETPNASPKTGPPGRSPTPVKLGAAYAGAARIEIVATERRSAASELGIGTPSSSTSQIEPRLHP